MDCGKLIVEITNAVQYSDPETVTWRDLAIAFFKSEIKEVKVLNPQEFYIAARRLADEYVDDLDKMIFGDIPDELRERINEHIEKRGNQDLPEELLKELKKYFK